MNTKKNPYGERFKIRVKIRLEMYREYITDHNLWLEHTKELASTAGIFIAKEFYTETIDILAELEDAIVEQEYRRQLRGEGESK